MAIARRDLAVDRRRGGAPPRSGRRVRAERAGAGDHDRGRSAVRRRRSPTRRWPAGARRCSVATRCFGDSSRWWRSTLPTATGSRRRGRARRSEDSSWRWRAVRRLAESSPRRRSCSPTSRRPRRSWPSSAHGWPRTRCSRATPVPPRTTRTRRWRPGPRTSRSRSWPCTSGGTRGSRSATPAASRTSTRRSIARNRSGPSRRSSRPTATSPIASGRSRAPRSRCSGSTRAAPWPTVGARSARGRGARSPRSSCWSSSAGGTRCSPGPCR